MRKENVCGGTDTYFNKEAPTEIKSNDLVFFSVASAFKSTWTNKNDFIDFCAFVAPVKDGFFTYFRYSTINDNIESSLAVVDANPLPRLAELVGNYRLALNNGKSSFTHGLPENFGGSVDIKYASGESIYYSDNSSPVFSYEFAKDVLKVIKSAQNGKKVKYPDFSALTEIYFEEKSKYGNSSSTITLRDGVWKNTIEESFGDDKSYVVDTEISVDTFNYIKEKVEKYSVLAWSDLPVCNYSPISQKKLVFKFGKQEFVIDKNVLLPEDLNSVFFNIELKLK